MELKEERRGRTSVLTLSFCFSVRRLLSWSRSYSVTSTFFSQSLMRRGNSLISESKQGSMTWDGRRDTEGEIKEEVGGGWEV